MAILTNVRHPVLTPCGPHTDSRRVHGRVSTGSMIQQHYNKCLSANPPLYPTSPMTRELVDPSVLIPNHNLRKLIRDFSMGNGWYHECALGEYTLMADQAATEAVKDAKIAAEEATMAAEEEEEEVEVDVDMDSEEDDVETCLHMWCQHGQPNNPGPGDFEYDNLMLCLSLFGGANVGFLDPDTPSTDRHQALARRTNVTSAMHTSLFGSPPSMSFGDFTNHILADGDRKEAYVEFIRLVLRYSTPSGGVEFHEFSDPPSDTELSDAPYNGPVTRRTTRRAALAATVAMNMQQDQEALEELKDRFMPGNSQQ